MQTLMTYKQGTALLVSVAVALLLLWMLPTAQAAAAPAPPEDRLELVRLATVRPSPTSPPGSLRFEAQVNYSLATAKSGFLVLFVFEDGAQRSSQKTSDPIPVQAGAGRVSMDIEHLPRPEIKALTLIAGLFTPDERLLGWVATNPLPMATWLGRAEFEEAMAARQAGNYAGAIDRMSRAIQLMPETGELYFWRADTRVRLGQYDEAIGDYTAALKLMPQHRASLLGRGVAWTWKEQWDPALQDLTAALESAATPDELSGWAHRARGVVYAALGKPEEAIGDYQAYLALAPEARDRTEVEGWIEELRVP